MTSKELRELIDENGVIVIPNDVEKIAYGTFSYMTNLKEVVIGENIKEISAEEFILCTNLRKVTILSKDLKIYPKAFKDCVRLEEIDLSNVSIISNLAFENCESIKEITLSEKLCNLSSTAFLGCKKIEKVNVLDGNEKYVSIDGVLYSKDLTELLYYPSGRKEKVYKVIDEAKTIVINAFSNCQFLEDVDLNNVSNIKTKAFENAIGIKNVKLNKYIKLIDFDTFKGCTNLVSIDIPENVITIGSNAFKDCKSLKKISIPKTCVKLGKNFIQGVGENLDIIYGGNKDEWDKLVKDRDVCVSHQTNNDFHYYGYEVDKYVKDRWEKEIVIDKDFKYNLITKE